MILLLLLPMPLQRPPLLCLLLKSNTEYSLIQCITVSPPFTLPSSPPPSLSCRSTLPPFPLHKDLQEQQLNRTKQGAVRQATALILRLDIEHILEHTQSG